MDTPAHRPYRHGDLPNAMRSAARAILDEGGLDNVGLRETARRVGVSATAAYRHFASKEDLLASVATEGFRELRDQMEAALDEKAPLASLGLAYLDFAQQKRGLFRLMFGPVLSERAKYPELDEAAQSAFGLLKGASGGAPKAHGPQAVGGWALVHGLASLTIDGLIPKLQARDLAEEVLRGSAAKRAN
jgi:AcrR family transcriptional regulator